MDGHGRTQEVRGWTWTDTRSPWTDTRSPWMDMDGHKKSMDGHGRTQDFHGWTWTNVRGPWTDRSRSWTDSDRSMDFVDIDFFSAASPRTPWTDRRGHKFLNPIHGQRFRGRGQRNFSAASPR